MTTETPFVRARLLPLLLMLVLAPAGVARGQDAGSSPPQSPARSAAAIGRFLAGAALGLGAHEAAHVLFDVTFDAGPGLRGVDYGGIPFFAISHHPVSPGKEFVISSAGFWAQHGTNELLLSRRPGLRRERAALMKGMFAFNTLASVAYAGAAFTQTGPDERDTLGMSSASGLNEASIGLLILGPATLDAVRYARPEWRWVRWTSRVWKVGAVLLVVKAAE
jgi:hypothetical protein